MGPNSIIVVTDEDPEALNAELEANAAFIITACNAYDRDQQTISELAHHLSVMVEIIKDSGATRSVRLSPVLQRAADNSVDLARAALARLDKASK